MKRPHLPLRTALLAALATAACASPSAHEQDVPFERLEGFFPSTYSGIEQATEEVIRAQDDWSTFWDRHQPGNARPAPPPVEFGEKMVLVVALGDRPTGGYQVRIQEVEERDGRLTVRALETVPGRGCGVTQALTQPVDAVLVPRGTGVAQFELRTRVEECG